MRYGSVCSGIEAATVAWAPLGWEPTWFAEVARFPSAVLQHHYPHVPNLGDFTKIGAEHGPIDLLVGGTPCQSWSVAGGRAGLADPRGILAFEFLALARRLRPRWLLFENVPGLLSSKGGRDFGTWLGALAECGYGFAYRVLDAQHFGVPQRRRRVFVVGCLGDWRRAAAVLFERACLSGDLASRREKGQGTAATLTAGSANGRGVHEPDRRREDDVKLVHQCQGTNVGELGTLRSGNHGVTGGVPFVLSNGQGDPNVAIDLAFALDTEAPQAVCFDAAQITSQANRSRVEPGEPTPTLNAESQMRVIAFDWQASAGKDESWRGKGRQHIVRSGDYAGALSATRVDAVCIQEGQIGVREYDTAGSLRANAPGTQPSGSLVMCPDAAQTLTAGYAKSAQSGGNNCAPVNVVRQPMGIRRLLPVECERLMGFPDQYTRIPYRSKTAVECPDGPRYAALGNSMAVPVIRWLGERIVLVESIIAESEA